MSPSKKEKQEKKAAPKTKQSGVSTKPGKASQSNRPDISVEDAAQQSILTLVDQRIEDLIGLKVRVYEKKLADQEIQTDRLNSETVKINNLLVAIVLVLLVGFASLLATVGGMVIDTVRYHEKDTPNIEPVRTVTVAHPKPISCSESGNDSYFLEAQRLLLDAQREAVNGFPPR